MTIKVKHALNTYLAYKKDMLNLKTIRLSLSGALLGIAVIGILANGNEAMQALKMLGAVVGGAAVLFAKARHFI